MQGATREILIRYSEIIHHEDSQTLEQVTDRRCRVCILGNAQYLTGQGLEQTNLSRLCFQWWFESDNLQRSLPICIGSRVVQLTHQKDGMPSRGTWTSSRSGPV